MEADLVDGEPRVLGAGMSSVSRAESLNAACSGVSDRLAWAMSDTVRVDGLDMSSRVDDGMAGASPVAELSMLASAVAIAIHADLHVLLAGAAVTAGCGADWVAASFSSSGETTGGYAVIAVVLELARVSDFISSI